MQASEILAVDFFVRDAETVARDLLGRHLVRKVARRRMVLRIVETEAYLGREDRASHAWNGRRTPRNEVLYREGGCAYIYFIYGMWHCLNAVTGPEEDAGAVLIRAGEPLLGERYIRANRGLSPPIRPGSLAGGPGKLCQALELNLRANGLSLRSTALHIAAGDPVLEGDVAVGPRIGVDYAGDAAAWPLRFAVRGCREVSRPHLW